MPESPNTPAETFYVTTPIYYVNARPHIGHAYTTIVADVVARRQRLLGHDTFFLTGTDEHGQKIERSAAAAGIPPQQFADGVSQSFQTLWDRMGITYSDFIRTTEPRHTTRVQHLFQQLCDNDAIYKGTYTGQYCVSDEAYVDGPPGVLCPDCGRPTETVSEENFYFRLSRFQLPLLNLIESNTLRIEPESRRNEVLSFLNGPTNQVVKAEIERSLAAESSALLSDPQHVSETQLDTIAEEESAVAGRAQTTEALYALHQQGLIAFTAASTPFVPGALKDLSISRTSFSWGIPVPGDEKHVIYVWLDALANYMTALGYGSDNPTDEARFHKFWPADLHLVGKEIIRFHCVYWPAFLLALDPNWATLATASRAQSSRPEESEASRSGETPASAPAQSSGASSTTAASLLSSRSAAEGSASLPGTPGGYPLGFDPAFVTKWLPKSVVAHGWLLFEESKMSKSRGNIVRTETILQAFGDQYLQGIRDHNARELKKDPTTPPVPEPSAHDRDLFATDVLRYFLLREIPFGNDGSFSFDSMITRYNAVLANTYGNQASRITKMIVMYRASLIPEITEGFRTDIPSQTQYQELLKPGSEPFARTLAAIAVTVHSFGDAFSNNDFARALDALELGLSFVDLLITETTPWQWAVADTLGGTNYLDRILYTAAESIRILTALLHPILPFATARVWAQLGLGSIEDAATRGDLRNLQWGGLQPGTRLGPLAPIFPRADKGLAQTMADLEQNARPATSAQPNDLTAVANDERDAATPTRTAFREAPLASVAQGTTDQPLAAEAKSEAATKTPGAPSMARSDMDGNVQGQPGGHSAHPPSPSHAVLHAAPSPFSNPSTSPAAPPRTSALVEAEPILHVGGSSAPAPELPRTPSFVAAEPSGVFASASAGTPVSASPADSSPQISIDDFIKVELRVAQVLVAERIPKADKLLRLEVDLGDERRQILSGIAPWYTPEDLVGQRIIIVANLAPRKMRGLDSHGMLLAASGPEDPANPASSKPILATVPDPIPLGTRLK